MNTPIKWDYYKRSIPLPGQAVKFVFGTLTYLINPNPTPQRTILLVSNDRKWLTTELQPLWDNLVQETEQQQGGNFTQDKFLVNRIKKGPKQFPQFRVAIHHFGPVPVLMTGFKTKQELHGEIVEAEVAMYYNRPGDENHQFTGMFPNILAFLQSLTGDYDIIMQRYFEDVAQIFRAIATHSSLQQAFTWGKKAEDFIGQSIQSKLKDSMPKQNDWTTFNRGFDGKEVDELIARCLLFQKHDNDIFEAQYFRITALFFINELYRHLGLESRDYSPKFLELANEFDTLLGKGASAQIIENNTELHELQQMRVQFKQDDLFALKDNNFPIVWMQGMLAFAIFLLNLNRNKVEATKGRIFISFNHRVPVSEHLKKQIKSYYKEWYPSDIEVLTVENLPSDTNFTDVIQPRIWQCDRMLVIVPKKASKMGEDDAGNYEWLAKEAEYGLFLDKRVTFLLETGYDKVHWESILTNENLGFLSPEAGDTKKRSQKLQEQFRTKVFVEFNPTGDNPYDKWEDLNAQMKETLEYNATGAIAMRHHNMVKGFLMQFTKLNLLTIQGLHKILGADKQFTKGDAENMLNREFGRDNSLPFLTKSQTRKAFATTWVQTKGRSFIVRGQSFTLLENVLIGDKIVREGLLHKYILSYERLLKALQPKISDERLKEWAKNLLIEVLNEKK